MTSEPSQAHQSDNSPAPEILRIARKLTAISESGLWYCKDQFDIGRFHEIGELAQALTNLVGEKELPPYRREVASVAGYTTPKVDVRGGVFNNDGEVLLVREIADEGRWTLPGGWCDINEKPSEAVEREVREEAGLITKVSQLAALIDRDSWPHYPPIDHQVYKLFFICEQQSAEDLAFTSIETSQIGWFDVDNPPELSLSRTLPEQLVLLKEHWLNPGPAYVD
ncbi:NUDIX hydrolase N-terminal domain-containing protein [Ancrocorticia populi]|uniref:NUDIX hydrolase N-terminal domain-containing protein n=1 Tax=Ancrocorticia populi TaxID=2175228 RepID=UPI003F91E4F9